jgi:hypothetical protein
MQVYALTGMHMRPLDTHYFRQIRAFASRLRIWRHDGPAGCR